MRCPDLLMRANDASAESALLPARPSGGARVTKSRYSAYLPRTELLSDVPVLASKAKRRAPHGMLIA